MYNVPVPHSPRPFTFKTLTLYQPAKRIMTVTEYIHIHVFMEILDDKIHVYEAYLVSVRYNIYKNRR